MLKTKQNKALFDAKARKESQCTISSHSVDRVQESDEVECEQMHVLLSVLLFSAFSWVWNLLTPSDLLGFCST